MPRRAPWLLMGVALLLLSPTLWPKDAAGRAEVPQLTHSQIRAIVAARNPLLGPIRSDRIAASVERCRSEHKVSSELVLAVMTVESDMRPWARSPKGAIGLMQVMPASFRSLELPGAIAHLESNIEAGCILLADNIRRLGKREGISAYFWGNRIRGSAYLERVESALDELRTEATAGGTRG